MTMSKRGRSYNIMDEFPWLWSQEEREAEKMATLERELMRRATTEQRTGPRTLDDQNAEVQAARAQLEQMMQEARRKARQQ